MVESTFKIDYSLPSQLPTKQHKLYDNENKYELLVVGTGLTECTASSILTVKGVNILQIDDNDFYGRSFAAMNLKKIIEQSGGACHKELEPFKDSNTWHVNAFPKALLRMGLEVDLINKLGMNEYYDLKPLRGYFTDSKLKVTSLPITLTQALKTGIIGWRNTLSFPRFINNIMKFDINDPKTHFFKFNQTTKDVLYDNGFSSEEQIQAACFVFALHTDESHLFKPALETMVNIQRYVKSANLMNRDLQDTISPFIYIDYGAGDLCGGYARKAGVYGGHYRLMSPLKEILYDENSCVRGAIFVEPETKKDYTVECNAIVVDPEMMPEKCIKTGDIISAIVITKQPIPSTEGKSCQIVVPPKTSEGKMNATYLCMLSQENKVCPKGFYVTSISTTKDFKDDLTHQKDLKYALKLFEGIEILHKLIMTKDILTPKPGYEETGLFITHGIYPTTHFQKEINDAFEVSTKVLNYFRAKGVQ